jgi:hypothetical protein
MATPSPMILLVEAVEDVVSNNNNISAPEKQGKIIDHLLSHELRNV